MHLFRGCGPRALVVDYASLADGDYTTSLEISINAADKLIARPEMLHSPCTVTTYLSQFSPIFINNPNNLKRVRACSARSRLWSLVVACASTRKHLTCCMRSAHGIPSSSSRIRPRVPSTKSKPFVCRLRFPYVGSPNVPIGAFEVNGSENGTLSPTQSSALQTHHDLDTDLT